MIYPALRSAMSRALTAALRPLPSEITADFFVDSVGGSDANAGTSAAAPFQSLAAAQLAASNGNIVGLKRDQNHTLTANGAFFREHLSAFGAGGYATVDGRQLLSGNTWTAEAGGVWKTSINLSIPTVQGGNTANSTHFGVWWGGQFAEWMVGGVDIAANILSCAQAPAGKIVFSINRAGSAVQDIRNDTPSVGPFDLYVRLPDSVNPNGALIHCSNLERLAFLDNLVVRNVDFVGAWGKDSIGVSDYNSTMTFIQCRFREMGAHAFVGPANVKDVISIGAPRKGASAYGFNRVGQGINFYSNVFTPSRDLTVENLTGINLNIGIYGHGSNNQCYRTLFLKGVLDFQNVSQIMQFDVAAGRLPIFAGGISSTAFFSGTNIDRVFSCDGNWQLLGGGNIAMTASPVELSYTSFAMMTGTGANLYVKDFTVTCPRANVVGYANRLCERDSGLTSGFVDPTLILDNFVDASIPANRLMWIRGASPAIIEKVHLHLKGNTQLWDLADAAGRINFPASLTVEAGCRFGWGNRTRAEIRAALNAAGVIHTISDSTTIVGLAGNILSNPI